MLEINNFSIPPHAVVLIIWEYPKNLAEVVTLLACTIDVFCLNFCCNTDSYYKGLSWFFTVNPVKSGIIPEIQPRNILYVFLTIWYSLFIIPIDTAVTCAARSAVKMKQTKCVTHIEWLLSSHQKNNRGNNKMLTAMRNWRLLTTTTLNYFIATCFGFC